MSLFDKLRGKATQWARNNPDKVDKYKDEIIRRAGDAAGRVTGGRNTTSVRDDQQRLDDRVGNDGDTPSRADERKGGL